MLSQLIFLFAAFALCYSGAIDTNCTTIDSAGALIFTPSAVVCTDKLPQTGCDQLFNKGTAATAATLPAAGGLESARTMYGCYQLLLPTAAPNEDIKKYAASICPKYCGLCCITPEYNCENAQNPRIVCSQVTKDMCESTQWREIIAQDCPSACGFCLLGGCIDAAPDCEKQQTMCANPALNAFTQVNCKRTCGLCGTAGGSSTTMSSIIGGGACGDSNPNCATWVRNGFCNNNFYSLTQKMAACGRSCGMCGGK